MNGKNALLALELARGWISAGLQALAAIATAHAQGRDDLTPAELDAFRKADDAARAALDAKIAAARAADE